jgi:hypothetical protein
LLGYKTKIITDCFSIKHILTQPRLTKQQMLVLLEIIEFDFEIDYLPKARLYIQNTLSRYPDYKELYLIMVKIPLHAPNTKMIMSLE